MKKIFKLNFLEQFDPENRMFILALRTAISGASALYLFLLFGFPVLSLWAGFAAYFIMQTSIRENFFYLHRLIYLFIVTIVFSLLAFLGASLSDHPLLFTFLLAFLSFFSAYAIFFSSIIFNTAIWGLCVFLFTHIVSQENIAPHTILLIFFASGCIAIIVYFIFDSLFLKKKNASLASAEKEHLIDILRQIRKNIKRSGFQKQHLQYALLFASTVLIAQLLIWKFSITYGYWIILTIFVCFLPSTGKTFLRVIQRVLGTFIGAMMALLLMYFFGKDEIVFQIMLPISLFITYYLRAYDYGISTIFLTVTVVLFVHISLNQNADIAWTRFIMTLIGGAIACFVGYLPFINRFDLKKEIRKINKLLKHYWNRTQ